jgi:hypothetical protein
MIVVLAQISVGPGLIVARALLLLGVLRNAPAVNPKKG